MESRLTAVLWGLLTARCYVDHPAFGLLSEHVTVIKLITESSFREHFFWLTVLGVTVYHGGVGMVETQGFVVVS